MIMLDDLGRRQCQHRPLCLVSIADVTLALVSAFNALCCLVVLFLAAYKRAFARRNEGMSLCDGLRASARK